MGLFAVRRYSQERARILNIHRQVLSGQRKFLTKRRVDLTSIRNCVLISIHQNKFPDDYPHGAQSFFSKNPGSEELAKNAQELLVKILDPQNKREAREIYDSVYLMKRVKCPAILVECGFLSNPRELVLLQTEEYQTKIAACLTAAFLNTCEILEEVNGKG